MGLLTKIGLAVPVTIGNLITKGISAITGKQYGTTTIKEASETTFGKVLGTAISATAIAATGGYLATTPSAAASVATAAKSLIPTTTKGKLIGTAAALITVPAVIKSPKLQEAIINTPSSLVNFGSNVGYVIENPTIENAKNIFKENPLIAGGIAAATVAVAGIGLGSAASIAASLASRSATKENTAAILETSQPQLQTLEQPTQNIISSSEKPVGNDLLGVPIASPQTTTIQTGKKRYKKHKVALSPSINNNIQVNIQNRSIGSENKKYIKMAQYV
jgi:hypothetical protein